MNELPKELLHTTTAFLDPAGGKKGDQQVKAGKARSAIVVVSADIANRVFVRETWAQRCTTDRIFEKVYELNAKYDIDIFGVEANAQQSLFVDSIIRDATERRIEIPVRGIVQPTSVPKEFRIRTHLQPLLPTGRLLFKKEHTQLLKELLDFPVGATVDMVDALASAVSLLPKRYALEVKDGDREQRLAYLRSSGAPAHYIERVARETSHDVDMTSYFKDLTK